MKLIVGLGNVGAEYAATRHNVGFQVAQLLAERHKIRLGTRYPAKGRLLGIVGDGQIGGAAVRLLLPQTMMNASGDSLADREAWGVSLDELLIVCDDVNLPLGALRMRPQGSAGGHHGLASCLAALQTEAIARLRVGVAGEPLPSDLTEYVVSEFRPGERPVIRRAIDQAAEACERWATDGLQAAMNRMHLRER